MACWSSLLATSVLSKTVRWRCVPCASSHMCIAVIKHNCNNHPQNSTPSPCCCTYMQLAERDLQVALLKSFISDNPSDLQSSLQEVSTTLHPLGDLQDTAAEINNLLAQHTWPLHAPIQQQPSIAPVDPLAY